MHKIPRDGDVLRIRPHFTLVPVDPDRVLVRSGLRTGQSFNLTDDSKKGKLSVLMDGLLRGSTEEQLVDAVGKEYASDVHALLEQLRSHLIIEVVPAGVSIPEGAASGLTLASSFGAQAGEDLLTKLSSRRLVLWGLGGIGSRIALQLAQLGVGSLTLVDSRPLSPADVPLATAEAASSDDGTRSDVLAKALGRLYPDTQIFGRDSRRARIVSFS